MNRLVKSPDTLAEEIRVYNQHYRAGHPDITDQEYDDLVQVLKRIDPDNDWFKHVEPVKVSVGRKVSLPIPMKSLNKAKNLAEVSKWCKSIGLSDEVSIVCMPKFDGVSLLINEHSGMAYSRGGVENEGQDCSKHVLAANIKSDTGYHYTFGEFIISNKNWNEFFKGRTSPSTGEKYKSPRNTAAGMLNADNPTEMIRYASLFRYGTSEYDLLSYATYSEVIKALCVDYDQPFLFKEYKVKDLTEDLLKDMFSLWSQSYPIDGIVIYVNYLDIWDIVGRHQTTGNPLYAIAYKHPDFSSAFTTVVKSVSWKVSKAGFLKPVVNIETVDTGDCEMENPTGYNAAFINGKGITKGAKILVTRSGGVIPKILSTIAPASMDEQNSMWNNLSRCPSCGAPTKWNNSKVELCCTNPNCDGRRLAKIIHFFTICGAENMGEESYSKLFNAGFNTIKKILNITPEDIVSIDGFGESVMNDILSNNKKIIGDGLDIAVLMHASDCFEGIGQKKAEQLLAAEGDLAELLCQMKYFPSATENDSKTYQAFCNGIKPFYDFIIDNGLVIKKISKKIFNPNGKCSGMKVCFTGIRDKELEMLITSEGGEIVSGVSKKTTHLLVADLLSSSSKMTKAMDLGIEINTINMFRQNNKL